jgi:hypothetical protein
LHGALVLLGRRARGEGAEIAAPLGARVHFARNRPCGGTIARAR